MASVSQFGLFVLLLHIVSPSVCENVFGLSNKRSDGLPNVSGRPEALKQTGGADLGGDPKEERSKCTNKSILKQDIVTAINQARFPIAEEKMLELNDPAIVADIVRGMSNSDHGFGVLVHMTKGLNNTSIKTQVLWDLYYKAKNSDHISTPNLIALAKCLPGKGKSASLRVLLNQITANAVATFVDVLKWQGDYQTNSEVRALAEGIAEWPDVSEKVMIGLVSGVFETVDSKQILKAVYNHTDAWQALIGVETLMVKLNDTDSFRGGIALDIGSYVNEILTRIVLHPTVGYYARRVQDKIPGCIRNLTSSSTFCFWNKYKNSFLIQSSFEYLDLHYVHLGKPLNANDRWRHERKGERVFFVNDDTKENLHSSDLTDDDFHIVFSSRQQGDLDELDDKNAWVIETFGDSCFLKNYLNNEYLYASNVQFSTDYKCVGTKDKRNDSADNNRDFAWQIVSC